AETRPESSVELNHLAWRAVKACGQNPDVYNLAHRQAEAAARLTNEDREILSTLGVAQYRMGFYLDATATFTRLEKLDAKLPDASNPERLAFLAMSHFRLGHKEQARTTLRRLRAAMQESRWAEDAEARGFLSEAAELIEGKSVARNTTC